MSNTDIQALKNFFLHDEFARTANITFVRGTSSGIISAQAQEIVNHHHLPFCEVRVTDEAGNLLAIFTASGYRKEGVKAYGR